jgi:anti-sigma factor RsiW
MTERDLGAAWARTQIEAWADGSLTSENRRRMAAALAADPKLRATAERAVAVRRALRAAGPEPVPAALRRRLLAIPAGSTSRWRAFALPAAAGVALAFVAAAWLRPEPAPLPDPRVAAATQDLELALRYLQKSARITEDAVTTAVGSGLRDAVAASRAAIDREKDRTGDLEDGA